MKNAAAICMLVGVHFAAASLPSLAQNLTGNELLEVCTNGADMAKLRKSMRLPTYLPLQPKS